MAEDGTERPGGTGDEPDGAIGGQTAVPPTPTQPSATVTPLPSPPPTPTPTQPSATATPLPSPTPTPEPEDAGYHFERADDLLNSGLLREAIAAYDDALALDPELVDAYFNRGLAFLDLSDWEQAVADYTRVLELAPGDVDAYFNRGLAFLQSGKLQEATEDFTRVLEHNANDAEAYFNRGLAALQLGKREQAAEDYTKVLELDPDNDDAHFNLAAAYTMLRQPDKIDFAARSFTPDDLETSIIWNIYRGEPTRRTRSDSEAATEQDETSMLDESMEKGLPDQILTPYFEDSSPAHGEVLPRAPRRVDINFKQELAMNSSIMVTRDGEPLQLGTVILSTDPWRMYLSMGVPINEEPGDGLYEIKYSACWPDGSCNQGALAFIVDAATGK